MAAPYTRGKHRAAAARRDTQAISHTADILRQVASRDSHLDAHRGYVSYSLAALVEAIGRGYRVVPIDVAACVMGVVVTVDRATARPGDRATGRPGDRATGQRGTSRSSSRKRAQE
ncbi:hypothetical protein [Pseudonocardia nigra]|uniref:hypothetical protein n=1 Tax=Pseudonocardia nigra TaxID=1921578 RepID=UPI001C5EB09A|nr:hypothetical protein [Pseudonocardia nigra]